jgi:hypothetical protein
VSTLLLIVLSWIAIDTTGGGAPAQRRTPTFNREVSRILQLHCVSCHRSGDIAPFPLDTYASARDHATAIKKATRSREMPPWMPSACCGTFKGARRLSAGDIAVLGAWADAGAPEGDRRDRPPPLAFDGRWTLGTPDRVLTMADAHTPVSATDVYRCFPIRTGLTSAAYVSALDVQPGNRALVHHVALYADPAGTAERLDAADPQPGYPCFGGPGLANPEMIGGWGPGMRPMALPRDVGVELPANALLVMQVHYAGRAHHGAPRAAAAADRTAVGLYLASGRPAQLLRYVPIVNPRFAVPANESNYEVSASMRTPVAARIWGVAPHMHLLGKRIRMDARLPDGSIRRLIEIERWNFNWQGLYMFDQPLDVPAGTVLSVAATYDNSPANPRNPNRPPKPVSVGEATTDEMCVGVVAVTWADGR